MNVEQANEIIWYGKTVIFEGIEYTLTAIIKRKHYKEPKWYYQAELQDKTAKHSIVIADLKKVEIIEGVNNG